MSTKRRPDVSVKTPCGGLEGDPNTKWREIGEAWWRSDKKSLSCRIDLPPQNGRIVLVPPRTEVEENK